MANQSANPAKETWMGLLGGLGVGATIHYYQELARRHEARGVPLRLLMAQADMRLLLRVAQQGDRAAMAEHLAGLVERLAAGGASFAVIPAITPHMCAPELAARSPIPLLNLVEETVQEIQRRGIRRVALFGSRFTVESRMFGQLEGIEVVMPTLAEIDAIHTAYFQIVDTAAGGAAPYETMHRLAHELLGRGAEAIILAGTELALLFNESNTDFPHVDCARVHLDAIMHRLA
jgi:aspartate racemase